MAGTIARRRSRRMELRTTEEERALIDRAVAVSGTDLTEFVVTHASEADPSQSGSAGPRAAE